MYFDYSCSGSQRPIGNMRELLGGKQEAGRREDKRERKKGWTQMSEEDSRAEVESKERGEEDESKEIAEEKVVHR